MVWRIHAVYLSIVIFFLLILFRLFYWQVLSSDELGGQAEKQRNTKLPIPALRGEIFASDGSPLVINQEAFGVYIEPSKSTDVSKSISALSQILNIPESTISSHISSSSVWVPIKHKVEEQDVLRIKASLASGISFTEESKRFYPEGSMSAHLLGFVGKNSKGDDQGYFGIEGYYDEQLRGVDGVVREEVDASGNPILSGNRNNIPPKNGRSLVLYLDKTIQFIVEKNLKAGIARYGAKGGTVIVMDPITGGILAMASYPSYGQNDFIDYPEMYYKNPAVSASYEPGSTFKTLVMATAFNERKITSTMKFQEDGPIEIGGFTIRTWNQKYHGEVTPTEILQYSSNVGMVMVQKTLEDTVFLKYLSELGIGSLTGIDLQDESTPNLRPKGMWYEIDYATASFGQGIAVTPLQMVRAVSAIANGGKLMRPYVVKEIRLDTGEVISIGPHVDRTVFRPEVARIVTEMMVSAVDSGEARRLKPPGFRIAGKTGTAQIPIAGHYDSDKTIASFVGFGPVDSPRFTMLVTIQEPTSSPWGSETAAPIFFATAKEIFSYLNVSPS
ncbi:penicillin-binding protein 2 [Candidatus Gottesmanbacteria bacterium]|nr:penicillin-binding protein 2 [Candidatus Gottesmanbacteria bacterium]